MLDRAPPIDAVFTLALLIAAIMIRVSSPLALAALLAGCGDGGEAEFLPPERDPVAVQAVNDQIMTDPDLSSRNEANAALTSSTDNTTPPVVGTREAIDAARMQAVELLGDTVPELGKVAAAEADETIPPSAAIGLQDMAALTQTYRPCAAGMGYTANWAVNWSSALPIYPLSNLREGAGNTSGGCSLRAVSVITPVARDEVSAFYSAKARKEGMVVSIEAIGPAHRITAQGRGIDARIYLVSTPYGQTRIDMVVTGAK